MEIAGAIKWLCPAPRDVLQKSCCENFHKVTEKHWCYSLF